MKIRLVIATRQNEKDFYLKTATGRSLFFKPSFIDLRLFTNNKEGLPSLYNKVIKDSRNDPATIIFAHDDLHILDFFWCSRIKEGLKNFDVIGLAGNKRRVPKQPSWAFIDDKFTWDNFDNLSGVVGHGSGFPPSNLSIFGTPRQKVKLLDGLLLAVESETLIKNELFFDEQFNFHFYDLDFCRQAEQKNISLGTWDLALIHESGGNFGSADWSVAYQKYLSKWGE